MSRYRRARVPGATYFFTVNLLNRRGDLLVRHVDLLRETVRATRSRHPFHIDSNLRMQNDNKRECIKKTSQAF